MLSLTWVWTSFSTMAGGGVRGKVAGIAQGTTTLVGTTIEEPRVFIRMYRQAGEITTGIVVGTDISGTISEFLSASFNGTGEPGKITGIGSGKIPGVCKVQDTGRNAHSHNARWHHNSITLVMEDLIEATEIGMIEDSLTKSLYLLEMADRNNQKIVRPVMLLI